MRVRSIDVGAGETVTLPGGRFFTLIDTSADVDLVFLKDGSSIDADATGVAAGYEMSDQEFSEVKLTSVNAQAVKYGISKTGKGRYGSASLNVSGKVNVATSVTITDLNVTTSSGQLAANLKRYRAIIYSMKANTVDVLIGTSGNRIELEPGQSYIHQSTSALNFRTASGTADLAVVQEVAL